MELVIDYPIDEHIDSGEFGIKYDLRVQQGYRLTPYIDEFYDHLVEHYYNLFNSGDWKTYNIFTDDHPFLKEMRLEIWELYKHYCESYNCQPRKDVMINGWAVTIEKNGSINKHVHSWHNESYLTGVKMVGKTIHSTSLYPPYMDTIYDKEGKTFNIRNFKGQSIIFPNWLEHSVEPVVDDLRVGIAFDILKPEFVKSEPDLMPVALAIDLLGG